ncbi:MAG: 2-C-methyl-D-erythritol 2,4-cyclodiphosphate synthase [Dehalococcoidales bacterium]|nr:2-C-methyl-D-erythritol 2,4-cyclodiphosphate synthase [Dehalococcoidales bacterium]
MKCNLRIGQGYDVHPLVAGRKLVLGGVAVPFIKGLDGWSDADVLTHAVINALLGAAALGDIGQHFPPGEAKYKNISSMALLKETMAKLVQHGWQVANVDATVLADKPKLGDLIPDMRKKLSEVLGVDVSRVSIKAASSNGVGAVGRGEGIAAQAIVLIEGKQL